MPDQFAWAWICTLRALNVRGHKRRFSDTNDAAHACGDVLCLAQLKLRAAIDYLTILTNEVRQQFEFYQHLVGSPLLCHGEDGEAFVFDVLEKHTLCERTPLQQFSARKFKGMVCVLESEQPERLVELLEANPLDIAEVVPSCAMRLPPVFAARVAEGSLTSICMPHEAHQRRSTFFVKWTVLGLHPGVLPRPQAPLLEDGHPPMTQRLAQECADYGHPICTQAYHRWGLALQAKSEMTHQTMNQTWNAVDGVGQVGRAVFGCSCHLLLVKVWLHVQRASKEVCQEE